MAAVFGYKDFDRVTIKEGAYAPGVFQQVEQEQSQLRKRFLKVLEGEVAVKIMPMQPALPPGLQPEAQRPRGLHQRGGGHAGE